MRAEVPIGASRQTVWDALTNSRQLEQWFCEQADVDMDAGRYDFWGVYTPGVPDRDAGRHKVLKVVEGELLSYEWFGGVVEITLTEQDDETVVRMAHEPVPASSVDGPGVGDFWALALQHGLRGVAEFGISNGGRFDFTLPSVHPDRTVVSVDIDRPHQDVYAVLVADLANQWWVTDDVRHKVRFDPPREASTPFVMEGAHPSVLTWTLEDSGGRTRVTLVHSGFGPGEKGNIRGAMGWTNSLNWLRFECEVGPHWHERRQRAVIDHA